MNFMTKRANMRQNSIITLTDQNRKEIENLRADKEKLLKIFDEKKSGKHIFNLYLFQNFF